MSLLVWGIDVQNVELQRLLLWFLIPLAFYEYAQLKIFGTYISIAASFIKPSAIYVSHADAS